MNINWKTLKVLIAFVIIIVVTLSTVNMIRPNSYNGSDLAFSIGTGTVTVTNPSDQAVPVQLVGAGTRTFRVVSTDESITGGSTTQGSGGSRTQLFTFDLPSGTSEFAITRGTDVNFIANTDTELQATVESVSDDTLNITILITIGVVVAALYYASRVTEHEWIALLRRKLTSTPEASTQDTKPTPTIESSGQGQAIRSYGDNRAKL